MSFSPWFRGSKGRGSSRALSTSYQNGTIGTLAKATPVSVNSYSQMVAVDVSSQASVQAMIGLTSESVPSAAWGGVTDAGRLEDIITIFAIGDAVYVNSDGGLTNLKPAIGVSGFVAGMHVIFLGVIVLNEFDPLKKDLKLMILPVGRL